MNPSLATSTRFSPLGINRASNDSLAEAGGGVIQERGAFTEKTKVLMPRAPLPEGYTEVTHMLQSHGIEERVAVPAEFYRRTREAFGQLGGVYLTNLTRPLNEEEAGALTILHHDLGVISVEMHRCVLEQNALKLAAQNVLPATSLAEGSGSHAGAQDESSQPRRASHVGFDVEAQQMSPHAMQEEIEPEGCGSRLKNIVPAVLSGAAAGIGAFATAWTGKLVAEEMQKPMHDTTMLTTKVMMPMALTVTAGVACLNSLQAWRLAKQLDAIKRGSGPANG